MTVIKQRHQEPPNVHYTHGYQIQSHPRKQIRPRSTKPHKKSDFPKDSYLSQEDRSFVLLHGSKRFSPL
jgi:hypothetical protein